MLLSKGPVAGDDSDRAVPLERLTAPSPESRRDSPTVGLAHDTSEVWMSDLAEQLAEVNLDRLATRLMVEVEDLYRFVGSRRTCDARGMNCLLEASAQSIYSEEQTQLLLPLQKAALITQRLIEATGKDLLARCRVTVLAGNKDRPLSAQIGRKMVKLSESRIVLPIIRAELRNGNWSILCSCTKVQYMRLSKRPCPCWASRDIRLGLDQSGASLICAALATLGLSTPGHQLFASRRPELPLIAASPERFLRSAQDATSPREGLRGWIISSRPRDPTYFFGNFYQDQKEGPGILIDPYHLIAGTWRKDRCTDPKFEIQGDFRQCGLNRRLTPGTSKRPGFFPSSATWDYRPSADFEVGEVPLEARINDLWPAKRLYSCDWLPRAKSKGPETDIPMPFVSPNTTLEEFEGFVLETTRLLLTSRLDPFDPVGASFRGYLSDLREIAIPMRDSIGLLLGD